jgi:hypothetical protein
MGSICVKQANVTEFKASFNIYQSPKLLLTPSPEYIFQNSPDQKVSPTGKKILPRKCLNCNYQHYKQSPSGFCSGECKQSFHFGELEKNTNLKRNLSFG